MTKSVYDADENVRFILGELGVNTLYTVLLNPSTANDKKHDPTSSFVKNISQQHGYDGWCILNIYPLRSTKPHLLPELIDNDLLKSNFNTFNKYISHNADVWLGYGDGVCNREYLQQSKKAILQILDKKECNLYYCRGLTIKGNPFHSSYIRRQKSPHLLNKQC